MQAMLGVPFFVWAEVSAWQTQEIPDELRTYVELERFVGQAGAKAELTQAFPFVITGRAELIDFHIVNATPDTPPGMEAHQKIQISFELRGQDVKFVGFWSSRDQGVFTPMGTNMHAHFQTLDNKVSGHVQGLKVAHGLSSECADVVNVPGGNGAVAEEKSSAKAIEEIAAKPPPSLSEETIDTLRRVITSDLGGRASLHVRRRLVLDEFARRLELALSAAAIDDETAARVMRHVRKELDEAIPTIC
jgi:Alpha-acetolactate decarboxylase